jgi:transposase-like protein
MKASQLTRIVKWFCSKITLNECYSALAMFIEILNDNNRTVKFQSETVIAEYRNFKVDTTSPLTKPPPGKEKDLIFDWKVLKSELEEKQGKRIPPVTRHKDNKNIIPKDCTCKFCGAPSRYLSINNGKKASQVRCKICSKTSSINKIRRDGKYKLWCPHCHYALYKWKTNHVYTAYKCHNKKCSCYQTNYNNLTKEAKVLQKVKESQFKLHYQYRIYNLANCNLETSKPNNKTKVNLNKIHNDFYTVGLVLTYFINLSQSSRSTRDALKYIHGIDISHQTILNYIEASASIISKVVDKNTFIPKEAAADETYIIVKNKHHYTWFIIDKKTRAICGYNVSNTRSSEPALALLFDTYGIPDESNKDVQYLITDGNPSYDTAVMAYNHESKHNSIEKKTVIGLQNFDSESKEYRVFKQIVERLNRTYKFHTRPRAGFKTFEGAVTLTTLFIAFYNFMRPHSFLNAKTPIQLEAISNETRWPNVWIKLLAS